MNRTRMRSGPQTPFGPKDLPNSSYSLTRLAKAALAISARRAGTSESNVVELLLRQHAATVTARDFTMSDAG